MATDSNEQKDLITKFESMSNELLMEIFEYYDLYSLFYTFSLLNFRIENLLYYCQVHVDLDCVQPVDFVDFLAHILPKINPKNIRSLHSSNSSQITILAYDKSLVYFTQIRSLSLINIKANIIEYMVSRIHFSRLERVVLDRPEYRDANVWSPFAHFFDSNRYYFLRTYKDPIGYIEKITSVLLIIEYVTISDTRTPRDFLNFLNQAPHLKYVSTAMFFYNQYPEPVFLSPIPYHHALTHLHIILCGEICKKTVFYLFKCLARICHLKLKVDENFEPEFVDPIFWETCFSKYLLELKQLSLFSFTVTSNPAMVHSWNSITYKDKVLEQIEKSNYWSSHQWQIKFDSGMPTPQRNLYWAKFEVV